MGAPAWYREGKEEVEAVGPARGQPWQGITGTRSLLRVNPPPPFDLRIGGLEERIGDLFWGVREERTLLLDSQD